MLRLLLISLVSITSLLAFDVAIVKNTDGNVFAQRDKTNQKLIAGDQLRVGDVLITKDNSSVGIIFHDGTLLSLGENSILAIDEFLFEPEEEEFKFDIDMRKGLATFESGKIGKISPESVNFKVPDGVIGIRGTKFYVEVK